ncbi:type II toxin-antitoxin system PemK/MazF family toxin [uncultured Microbacterium sp.]|uniref:type II toxin-antitoxin system PemK/MazF family toxin n=1 Tax=uncultured Microbacterium sp. TaxID=191216 RepID=UPI0037DDC6A9
MSAKGFSPGDVFVVEFPMALGSTFKTRPAICLLADNWTALDGIVIVCAVTSSVSRSGDARSVRISDWESAGLAVESWAQIDRLHSTQARNFRKRLGSLSPESTAEVITAFRAYANGPAMQKTEN